MKPDISALLDDELEPGAASRTIDALRREKELQEAWNVYHLIGDALRRSPGYSHDLSAKVMARLAEERRNRHGAFERDRAAGTGAPRDAPTERRVVARRVARAEHQLD